MPLFKHLGVPKFCLSTKNFIKNCKMTPIFNQKYILKNKKNSLNSEENENKYEHIHDISKNANKGNNVCSKTFSTVSKKELPFENEFCKEVNFYKYERILLLEKYTKYDELKKQGYSDNYIIKHFLKAYVSHFTHTLIVNNVLHYLKTKYKIHVSLLKAYKKNIDSIYISSRSAFSPDAIFSIGGDGTYLEAAHIIANKYIIDEQTSEENKRIELLGINSDPRRSEGKLCVNYFHIKSCENKDQEQLKEIEEIENTDDYEHTSFYDFEKRYHKKKKINIWFTDVSNLIQELIELKKSKNNFKNGICCSTDDNKVAKEKRNSREATEERLWGINFILENNSLGYTKKKQIKTESTEKKETKNVPEETEQKEKNCLIQEGKRENKYDKNIQLFDYDENEIQDELVGMGHLMKKGILEKVHDVVISVEEYTKSVLERFFETNKCKKINRKYITVLIKKENKEVKTYKSINEVYIYEAIKNNVCTYINIDNKILKKLKSTALLITSGTGSTAWAYNVNKIDKKKMKNIINEFLNTQSDIIKQNVKNINYDLFSEYINNSICFHPNSEYMKCLIKEPVENNVYDTTDQIYKCNYINIKTCTSNTIIYIDGIYNIKIQPNDSITLYIKEDDFIVTYK